MRSSFRKPRPVTLQALAFACAAWAGSASAPALAQTPPPAATPERVYRTLSGPIEPSTAPLVLAAAPYAVLHTTHGDIVAQLLPQVAPAAVENFRALATGAKRWKHPITLAETSAPLYNNTQFFRVMRDVMICGGDPINRGQGEVGAPQPVEAKPEVRFSEPGMMALDLNGSSASSNRFFITLKPLPDWSGRYTIFAKVVGGLDVVARISQRPTRRPTVPLDPTLLTSIEVLDVPEGMVADAKYVEERGSRVVKVSAQMRPAATPTPAPTPAPTPTPAATSAPAKGKGPAKPAAAKPASKP